MKNLLFAAVLGVAGLSFASPNPYADYDKAMAPTEGYKMAVEWQAADAAGLAAATEPGVLADIVADETSAKAFLGRLRRAYDGCPTMMAQMAAVTQWVMTPEPCCLAFWAPSPKAGRRVWVKALVETAETAKDSYVKMTCLDQLRWCGCRCPGIIARIRCLGIDANDKAVREFADWVARELGR